MHLIWDDALQEALWRAEAEARGQTARLERLAAAREHDGLGSPDALHEAAWELGLAGAVDNVVRETLGGLETLGVRGLRLSDTRAGMPTLERCEGVATVTVPASPLEALRMTLESLVAPMREDPELLRVAVTAGLGGSGGCSQGCELPENEAHGPLFQPPR